jgi:putative membrane protein
MNQAVAQDANLRPVIIRILALSGAAFAFLLWLLYFRGRSDSDPDAMSFLPALNAALNGLAATCIITGFIAIRNGYKRLHITMMITAVTLSVVFLVSYITYHNIHGDTKFVTEGWIRYFYFFVLISHISCTVFALPLIMSSVYFAVTKRFTLHRRVAKYTIPVWLYVSITGVAIYFLLRANS